VVLGNQRVPIRVPRLRGIDGEVALKSYEMLHEADDSESIYNSILSGVSCRNYVGTIDKEEGGIKTSKSTISRQFVSLSNKKLKEFNSRTFENLDLVAIFMDGKSFARDQMVIALGIAIDGSKTLLGFTQTATENANAIGQFLASLGDRGLKVDQGILAIVDGSKGLIAALKQRFAGHVVIQRCQWHKRENVASHLPKGDQGAFKKRLQRAYERPTLKEAENHLEEILAELKNCNQSAAKSLQEGFSETLTLHRLGVFAKLGASFKTTNCIESINAAAERHCSKVDRWQNSSQKQRWLAAALCDIEPKLRRVRGSEHLTQLRAAIQRELKLDQNV
jgi:transposase-like protein